MKHSRKLGVSLAVVLLLFCVGNLTAAGTGDSKKPLFRLGVDTVFVAVSVTDPLNRCVTGLDKEAFKIFEDRVEQEISHFTEDPSPISVGVLLDWSGSMKSNGNINAARAAIGRFMESVNAKDEFFLVAFNQEPLLVSGFTRDSGSIVNESAMKQPGGRTAIFDAVYMGLNQIKRSSNERKALILITDGEDNSSRYSSSEIREVAKESDVQIYAIGEKGMLGYGSQEIQNIVQMTGGRAFFPESFNDLDYFIELIQAELRNEYIIGYNPTHIKNDGKWRRIQIKLTPPQGLPKLIVHAREGYYASKY